LDAKEDAHNPWVEQVGIHPKAFVFHSFLTEEERTHIIRLAAPMMVRSQVSGANGEGVIDEIRTSYGTFISRLTDPIIERIEKRISVFTHIPVSHQEDIQVLRYQKGQTYGAHQDSGANASEPGPQFRMATFLMYLSDVEEGGETAFPDGSVWSDPEIPKRLEAAGVQLSDCAKGHVAYKPKAGDAVLFYSFHPNGTMDPAATHTGCPVIKGIKWAAPVWMHIDEYEPADWARAQDRKDMDNTPKEPGLCEDYMEECKDWAERGECEANKQFMVGDGDALGNCRLACGVCKGCAKNDIACINANRKKQGYLELDRTEMEWLGVPWWLGDGPTAEL